MRFVDFTEKWLKEKQGTIKSVSLSTYQRLIECYLIPYFKDFETEDITEDELDKFKDYLKSLELSDAMICNIMKNIKYILYPKKRIKREKKTEKYLNDKDLQRLVNYLKKKTSRNNIVILLAVLTGLCPGELCGIQKRNINFEEGTILINSVINRIKANPDEVSKTKIIETESTHIRVIKIAKWGMDYLKKITTSTTSYIASGSKSPADPRKLQYALQKISKELNIKVTFKILQSTFIVNSLRSGATLSQIASFLGTTSIQLEKRGYKEEVNFDRILKFQEEFNH